MAARNSPPGAVPITAPWAHEDGRVGKGRQRGPACRAAPCAVAQQAHAPPTRRGTQRATIRRLTQHKALQHKALHRLSLATTSPPHCDGVDGGHEEGQCLPAEAHLQDLQARVWLAGQLGSAWVGAQQARLRAAGLMGAAAGVPGCQGTAANSDSRRQEAAGGRQQPPRLPAGLAAQLCHPIRVAPVRLPTKDSSGRGAGGRFKQRWSAPSHKRHPALQPQAGGQCPGTCKCIHSCIRQPNQTPAGRACSSSLRSRSASSSSTTTAGETRWIRAATSCTACARGGSLLLP